MALNYVGTSVEVSDSLLPVEYVKPVVAKFSPVESSRTDTYVVLKSVVENAVDTVTMDNIVTDITTQASAIITADYDTAAITVNAFAEIIGIETNQTRNADLYNDAVNSYTITARIKVTTP